MQAILAAAGPDLASFERLSAHGRSLFGPPSGRCERPMFALEAFRDDGYYPLPPVLARPDEGLVCGLDGHLWHDDVPTGASDALAGSLWALCRRVVGGELMLPAGYSGTFNLLVWDEQSRTLWVTADPNALFPLYYTEVDGNLLLASNLHLLARAAGASLDDLAVLETATLYYTVGRRTLYAGIKRLAPGESLTYEADTRRLTRRSHPEFFQRVSDPVPVRQAGAEIWELLRRACERSGAGRGMIGVMLSGGLDSRMVAAGFRAAGVPMVTCTHGEEGFQEVDAARRVARLSQSPHHLIDMNRASYVGTADELVREFWCADQPFFPVWHHGSRLLREVGAAAATTGFMLDASLGGHFHDVPDPRGRFMRRLEYAFRGPTPEWRSRLAAPGYAEGFATGLKRRARKSLQYRRPFFNPEYFRELESLLGALEEEVDGEIASYQATGITHSAKLVERFLTENHARKYSFSQEAILRMHNAVVVPTADRDLFRYLSELDPALALDHYLYHSLMREQARDYAAIPGSNSALPITAPTLVLEVARLLRNRYDKWTKRLEVRSHGRTTRLARFGAMNFERVIREGGALDTLDDLLCSGASRILEPAGIRTWLSEMRGYERKTLNLCEMTLLLILRLAESAPAPTPEAVPA